MKKTAIIILILLVPGILYSLKEKPVGVIESITHDKNCMLLFQEKPHSNTYLIVDKDDTVGKAIVKQVFRQSRGRYRYRALAACYIRKSFSTGRLSAGMKIVKIPEKVEKVFRGKNSFYKERLTYKERIITPVDRRPMVLVPAGEVAMGSSHGRKDELYGKSVHLKAFYIDVYEVTNRDYHIYVRETYNAPPKSWAGGSYDDSLRDMPVMVTWFEAKRYALWAGKTLPTEYQWEKAAKGKDGREYPTGGDIPVGGCNYRDLWKDKDLAAGIMKKYHVTREGLLPVYSLSSCSSPYGAKHMAGNAPEWTSSWYRSYAPERSRYGASVNRHFGTLYKVIRGGAWYQPAYELRSSARMTGGRPSLERDYSAGFRCVLEVSPHSIYRKK